MQNSVAKKIFAVGSAVAMTLVYAAPLAATATAHAAGTNVVTSDGTVSMIMPDGTRRAYTSAGAFLSYGFNSWSQVVPASAEDLAIPQSPSFIPPQDGSIVCSDRGTDKGTCYEISNGQKFGFTSAAVFTGLGFSFSNAPMADVSWMPASSVLLNNTTAAHLPGTLVNNNGTVQLMGNGGVLGIPDLNTFNSWGYSFGKVVPANAADKAMSQTGVMAVRTPGQLSPIAMSGGTTNPGSGGTPVTVGPISVSLSSSNPASGTLVQGQVAAPLAAYSLSGTGTVTGVTFQKLGVSSNNLLQNVYLYNGATRLTDAASVNSAGTITFANSTNLFTVNGSMNLTVLADIVCSGTTGSCENDSGQTVGVQLTGITLAGSMVASGVPISGNLMSVVAAPNVATVSVTNVTPSTTTCSSTAPCYVNPQTGLVAWQGTFNVNGQNSVNFSRMSLREIGSINYSDISNLKLMVDGAQVAQTQNIDSNGYATFAVSPVKSLTTGAHTVQVLADVTGGAGRTLSFTLQNQADIGLVDTTYNVGIAALPGSATSFSQISAGTYAINAISSGGGSFTVQSTNVVTTTNVSPNTTNATLGDWIVTTYGEPIKISNLVVGVLVNGIASSTFQLRNGVIMIGTSPTSLGLYGSTQSVPSSAATAQYQVNYVVQPGTPVYVEFRADIYNNSTATGAIQPVNGTTIQPFLATGVNNAQGMTSSMVTNLPGSNTNSATALTVSTGTVTLVANGTYSNQNTVAPQTQYHLASFYLNGTSIEDANISGINLSFGSTTAASTLNNVKVFWNGQPETSVKATVGATGNLYSVYHTLSKNTSALIDVYGDINQTAIGPITTTMEVTGNTVLSGQTIDAPSTSGLAGQTINVGTTGSLAVTLDSANTTVATLVAGNQQKYPVASFKFSATNDTFKVTDLGFTVATGGNSVASTLYVVDHTTGTVVGQQSVGSGTVSLSGLSMLVSGNKTYDIKLDLGTVGTGTGTAGSDVRVTLVSYTANGSNGTPHTGPSTGFTINGSTSGTAPGNHIYVYNAVPSVTSAGGSGTLSTGQQTLYTFTIGGTNVTWDKIGFNVNVAGSGVSVSTTTLGVYNSSNQLVANACSTYDGSGNTFCTATTEQPTGTFTLKGTVAATGALTGASVSTYIPMSSSSQSNATASAQTGSFVWSDNSASAHDLTTSTDWFTDYLVQSLPLTSYSLTHN
ncbi:MAG: hypothetical protein P4L74_03175 [Candidatus Doudnabacteria bacterium]|nr:hypothetical protein [Candidatus Doudnabacteria bacterium]